jgi:hypothetical protein
MERFPMEIRILEFDPAISLVLYRSNFTDGACNAGLTLERTEKAWK